MNANRETFFWHGASLCVARFSASAIAALPEERAIVARDSTTRQLEFAAGRGAARVAASAITRGVLEPLSVGQFDEPVFPAGMVGSIAHAAGWAAAAVGSSSKFRAIGVDLDDARRITLAVAPTIATPRELNAVVELGWAGCPDLAANFAFCAKEAFFKCQCALTGIRDLSFLDVELAPSTDRRYLLPRPHAEEVARACAGVYIDARSMGNFRLAIALAPVV
ncbi:4'-phosphopantetheinyl transferase EntD (siderophore biosynthesis) [Variovorax sp. YR750]|uniref:4'-phosphopantetheinyl transferase superfamily protein n=1 Tax=Variovorax sp. YR750 TaxID=1884384 RepID=UPI0008D0CC89|nr:4'-phosphopantetheinyl transferase superfamily protein [Variovorax sp. YR750]SEM14847.1 4'-phosphopantetheinyl transferase EntD (siderophore biosynthesis) [Variovorax sp. YR750]